MLECTREVLHPAPSSADGPAATQRFLVGRVWPGYHIQGQLGPRVVVAQPRKDYVREGCKDFGFTRFVSPGRVQAFRQEPHLLSEKMTPSRGSRK
jgi:hypothetical protein